ncbi:mannose-6-phosphate isomerase, class I [Jatrophihabitans sp. YIM 134969]
MLALATTARDYAWGSATAIPELLGDEPSGVPVAELWVGAHPGAPSQWHDGTASVGLDELVAADPVGMLGARVDTAFAGRLPFLLKLLAAEKALSLQVHPNLAQARKGYARENATGVPIGAAHRNYQDDNHKPELLCALTPFEALCGFRDPAETAELVREFETPELDPLLEVLQGATDLRAAMTYLLDVPAGEAPVLVAAAAAGARRYLETWPNGRYAPVARCTTRLAEQSPDEIGPVVALLLNLVRLEPGEAVFLAAGQIHAYVQGFGVEILANSDNVLRCGLTPKHVDAAELLRIASFDPVPGQPWPSLDAYGDVVYPVPVDDFELLRLEIGPEAHDVSSGGPQLLLATGGRVVARGGDADVTLTPGRAAFVPAGRAVLLTGTGTVFRATVGPRVVR